ncbi:hypothetical protein [Nitrospira sp. BLG_2]|uniref:hypothetical protein n=1 Tax=Nitrospira sp. BLG_2 TaxID=3397507 RepID=UPI003B9B4BAF
MNATPAGSLKTEWEVWTYDVWGNAKDGYEVNDRRSHGTETIHCPIFRYNVGTPQEFRAAHPTDKQLRKLFGVKCRIETDGDDTTVYVNRSRDGYPIGEVHCVSHQCLSPIK